MRIITILLLLFISCKKPNVTLHPQRCGYVTDVRSVSKTSNLLFVYVNVNNTEMKFLSTTRYPLKTYICF